MAKNKFDVNMIQSERVYNDLDQATGKRQQQGAASTEEIKVRRARMQTQGRKGCKAPRINIAFSEDNYRFVKIYASSTGQTITRAVNELLDYARTNPEFAEKARASIEFLLSSAQPEGGEDAE